MSYTFNETGISSLDTTGRLLFATGMNPSLTVDADALASPTVGAQFLLMDYDSWRLDNVDQGSASFLPYVDFTDLGAVVQGKLVNDTTTETLYYEITDIVPEPATMGLLILGGVALARRPKRPRR